MYSVGEKVILSNSGVCEVSEIVDKDFGAGVLKYYILKPVFRNRSDTIMIPVTNAEKIRTILSKDEAEKVLSYIKDSTSSRVDDVRQRKNIYHSVLLKGDERELAELIRSVYAHKKTLLEKNKPLSITDKSAFESAERMLFEELAVSLEVPYETVRSTVKGLLE